MAHCYNCNTTVVSLTRHDFNCCKCEETEGICVDGGRDYLKRSYNPGISKVKDQSLSLGLIPSLPTIDKCAQITTEGLGLLECLFGSTFIELSDYNPIEVEILESVGLIRKVGTIAVATTLLKRINKYGNYFTKIHL